MTGTKGRHTAPSPLRRGRLSPTEGIPGTLSPSPDALSVQLGRLAVQQFGDGGARCRSAHQETI